MENGGLSWAKVERLYLIFAVSRVAKVWHIPKPNRGGVLLVKPIAERKQGSRLFLVMQKRVARCNTSEDGKRRLVVGES